jgi:hypothetical protein
MTNGRFQKLKIKKLKKREQVQQGQVSTPGWPMTAGRPLATGRHLALHSLFLVLILIFFFLPSTFCACGQFFLIGSNTCPP